MTGGINNNLKATLAYQIAAKLDAQDENSGDGKINGSIWNNFAEEYGGKKIEESISLKQAMNSITTYLVRQAKTLGTSVDELAKEWLGKVSSNQTEETTDSSGAKATSETAQSDPTPPKRAFFYELPKDIIFPSATNIPEGDSNPPIMSDPKMKGEPNSEVKQKDGTTYCYNSDGQLSLIKDSNGNKTQEYNYNEDGNIFNYSRYEYDSRGNNTRTVVYNSNGSVDYYNDKEYNFDNKETSNIRRSSDGSVLDNLNNAKTEYNDAGKMSRVIYYGVDGKQNGYFDYEYDANGNNTREIVRNADGTVNYYTVYEYDEDGNETKSTMYNADGIIQDD